MKKFLITGILLICFANQTNAFDIKNCIEEISNLQINSKNILSYIKENHLTDKIMSICSSVTCKNINGANIEQEIKDFIKQNIALLKNKDLESALEAELKGFRIDKISINECKN